HQHVLCSDYSCCPSNNRMLQLNKPLIYHPFQRAVNTHQELNPRHIHNIYPPLSLTLTSQLSYYLQHHRNSQPDTSLPGYYLPSRHRQNNTAYSVFFSDNQFHTESCPLPQPNSAPAQSLLPEFLRRFLAIYPLNTSLFAPYFL